MSRLPIWLRRLAAFFAAWMLAVLVINALLRTLGPSVRGIYSVVLVLVETATFVVLTSWLYARLGPVEAVVCRDRARNAAHAGPETAPR
jgi:hypothetical protein